MLGKLIGGALVMGATSYGGWQVAARYVSRPRQLRDLATGLAVLQTEVEYGATPLPEALRAAAQAAGPEVGPFFASTARRLAEGQGITPGDALRGALAEISPDTSLRPADLAILEALAAVLGASGRQDQVRHLALCQERLAGEEARAQEERVRYEKVARYAGILSGAGLVLILF